MAGTEHSQELTLSEDANDAPSKRSFDFFGLPAELRNQIYQLLTEDFRLNDHVVIRNTMLARYLVLNRQFKEEYEHELEPRQTLVFTDSEKISPAYITLRGAIMRTTNAMFRIILVCENDIEPYEKCNCAWCAHHAEEWIQNTLSQLSLVRHVKFEIYPCYGDQGSNYSFSHMKKATEKLRATTKPNTEVEVKLHGLFRWVDEDPDKVYGAKLPLQGTWTEEEGWLYTEAYQE